MRLILLAAVVLLTLAGAAIPVAHSDGGPDEGPGGGQDEAQYEEFYTPPDPLPPGQPEWR